MKIKLSDIYTVMLENGVRQAPINELMGLRPSPGPQASYWFGKMARLFAAEFADINSARSVIIEQLATEDEDGNMRILDSDTEAIASYIEQFNVILKEEVDLPIRKVKVSELGKEFPITLELQARFYFMIDGEEEPA